jgi:hypothetical protein
MEQKYMKNGLFIVAGLILITAVELKLLQLNELFVLIVGFIGFAALLNGAFGLYYSYKANEE